MMAFNCGTSYVLYNTKHKKIQLTYGLLIKYYYWCYSDNNKIHCLSFMYVRGMRV